MALMETTLQHSLIRYATDFDHCVLCANDYAKEHKISLSAARVELTGKLKGEKIFKMNNSETCICKKHINEIAGLLNA
mgnify:CR=1 FL=1